MIEPLNRPERQSFSRATVVALVAKAAGTKTVGTKTQVIKN